MLPREHAELLLRWLQAPGGRIGWIPAVELSQIYAEFAVHRSLELHAWQAVGRELRRLLEQAKTYVWLNGRKVRVYHIPTAAPVPLTVVARDCRQRGHG